MKYIAMIQARTGSRRYPSKILEDVFGKTILERVIERVSLSKKIDEVIILTTYKKEDLKIVKLASKIGIRVFVGSSSNVLDRYYQAAKLLKPDFIIRITSDCPLFDPYELDKAIDSMDDELENLAMISETFPDGLDFEIVKFSAFRRMWEKAKLKSELEHVTLYIKNNPNLFKRKDFKCYLGNLREQRWTIDEKEDLIFIKKIYEHFLPRTDFNMEEIFKFLKANPDILKINNKFIRNEGLILSLKNDYEVHDKNEKNK